MAIKGKTISYLLLGALILLLLAQFLLPYVARRYVVKNSKAIIGRQVDMGRLRVNYFTGTLKIFDFKMYAANGRDLFFSFDTLVVDTEPYKYIANIKSLDRFYLQGLELNISKKDTLYNFDDLIAFHAATDTLSGSDADDEKFKYQLSNLELKDAAIHFYDGDVQKTTSFEDLELFLPYIEWDQEEESDADVELRFSEGGQLQSNFGYEPKSGNYEGTITITDLQLSPFYRYGAQYADIGGLKGLLQTTIHLKGNTGIPEDLTLSGDVAVLDLELTDKGGQKFLGSEKVLCNLEEVLYSKSSYVIGDLQIEKPYLKLELDSVSNNLFRIFRLGEADDNSRGDLPTAPQGATSGSTVEKEAATRDVSASGETSASGQLRYTIRKITMKDGVLEYRDNITGEPFDYYLSEITMDADSISSDSDWVDLHAEMLLNERGTLKASAGFNPQHPMDLDIDIAIKDFVLADLNIYSRHYTGHSILNGDMFYFTDSQVTDGRIKSENNLLIKGVSVENTKGGLWSLPLKLAVFILKDKNGNIELDVPVRGDLNNPEIDVWDLIGTTLKKKIFDATDNPARSLAKLVDAEPEELEAIILHYPDTLITGEQKHQLDLILELEQKKEGLDIELNYVFDLEALLQKDVLREGSLHEGGDKEEKDTPEGKIQKVDLEPVESAYRIPGTDLNADDPEEVTDSLLMGYGEIMVRNMRRYLKQRDQNTGITLQMAEISDPSAVGALPQFKVKYALRAESEEKGNTTKDSLTSGDHGGR